MVTLGQAHRKKVSPRTRKLGREARRVFEAARVSREYLRLVRPGGPGEGKAKGGLKPSEYKTLRASMERVARMSETDRAKFAVLRPAATAGDRHKAMQMRIRGVPYWQIAEELNLAEETVKQAVAAQLNQLRGEEVRNADVARQLHLERLDTLLQANWAKAMEGNADASTVVLRCMERSSKLLGLDAPQKVDITHRLKLLAEAEGLDYNELLAEANDVIKRLPPAR